MKNKKYFFVISRFFLTQVDKLLNAPRKLTMKCFLRFWKHQNLQTLSFVKLCFVNGGRSNVAGGLLQAGRQARSLEAGRDELSGDTLT